VLNAAVTFSAGAPDLRAEPGDQLMRTQIMVRLLGKVAVSGSLSPCCHSCWPAVCLIICGGRPRLCSAFGCATLIFMQRLQRIVLSLLVSLVFFTSTLAACNAHLSATEHPDCTRCLMVSMPQQGDEAPIHLPTSPHHCPDHPCGHLHAPFILNNSAVFPSLVTHWFFFTPLDLHGRELPLGLLRPPQT